MQIVIDPVQDGANSRVLRGSSFLNLAPGVRSSSRSVYRPSFRSNVLGLRITLAPTGQAIDPGKHAWGNIRGGAWIRKLIEED